MLLANNFDFQKFQALNMRLHTTTTDPASPVEGQIYWNSSTKRLRTHNGTGFVDVIAGDSAQLNGQAPSFYLGRANHTGTQTASTISDLATTVQGYRLDQFAAPTGSVSMNSQRLINLADPTNPQDAATRGWVLTQIDNAAAGIDSKPSVRVATTANITLSGTQTIDGVSVIAGDRVLVKNQSTATQNGVYVVAAGAWSRAVDADATGEITPGAFWYVEEGTTNGGTQWRCSNTGTITIGSTNITINQWSGGTAYTAGNGLNLTGNTFSVVAATNGGLSVAAGGVSIALQSNSGLTLGASGLAIQLPASSGLVLSASGLAIDTTLVARKHVAVIGDGTNTTYTVTHNFNTRAVKVEVMLNSGNYDTVLADVTRPSANTVAVTFGSAASANAYQVVVTG